MSTAQALAFSGARFIKMRDWKVGCVYIDNYDVRDNGMTWCFIHRTNTPDRKPFPVLLKMLEGDDWEELPDAKMP